MLEAQCALSRELIERIKDDMGRIVEYLQKENVDITTIPLYKIPEDIGRCTGHLECFK